MTTLIRDKLAALGLSQRGAARAIGIDERTMRRYCAGAPVPRVVWLALDGLSRGSGPTATASAGRRGISASGRPTRRAPRHPQRPA